MQFAAMGGFTQSVVLLTLFLSPAVVGFPTLETRETRCRTFPTDADWPSKSDWTRLNTTLEGRLIESVPLASICHDPNYDTEKCAALREIWETPQAYFGHPTQVMNPVAQNLSCAPFTAPSTPCLLGSLASYAINISSPRDVITGFRFAQRHNIRVSIKNTGHDYLSRSTGAGSLAFWTHNLKKIAILQNYTSKGYSGPAVRMGAGVQAFEAYEAAAAAGLRVVGGDCPSVGLTGGYTQGGGHGPLSTEYGLGADQVLEWEVVTSTGRHVIATPTKNRDLYWALSGGGPGTYGVVLSMVVRAFRDGSVGGASLTFKSGGNTDTYWDMVQAFYELSPSLIDSGCSLATYFGKDSWTLQVLTKASGDTSENGVRTLLSSFLETLEASSLEYSLKRITSLPSYVSHVDLYLGPLPYGIYNASSMIGGRLIPRSVVEESPAQLIGVFRAIAEAGYEVNVLCQDVNLNRIRGTSNGAKAENAVLPAWRDSLMHVVVASYWNYAEIRESNIGVIDQMTESILPLLYEITPGSGDYLNEADFQKPDGLWQQDFFGINYQKLKNIKRKWDPQQNLYANRAVGSDDWTIAGDGRLCKA